jgi:para-aminobenzoate synthetase component 1
MILVRALAKPVDAWRAWLALGAGPGRAVLESAAEGPGTGRWTILAARPQGWIRFEDSGSNEEIVLEAAGRIRRFGPGRDPFDALRDAMAAFAPAGDGSGAEAKTGDGRVLPFSGGAIGWIAYEMGRRLERAKFPGPHVDADPPLMFGLYGGAVLVDRATGEGWVAARDTAFGKAEDEAAWLEERMAEAAVEAVPEAVPVTAAAAATGPVAESESETEIEYRRGVAAIHSLLEAGDLYQVNLSARFSARCDAGIDALWRRLRAGSPEPFAACLEAPDRAVLCASMERMLSVRGRDVETRPIKGTRPRGATPAADDAARDELERSEKDRAELLMIVDLHRNDLGKVCEPGSVRVPTLFGVRAFRHVHHLEATVTGRLRAGADALDAVRAVFPAGSITGAPKIRAMQAIESLERTARGVYCGAIGYLGPGPEGAADFAVAIRTGVLKDGVLRYSAGGGIVWDSDARDEWAEVLAKSTGFARLC